MNRIWMVAASPLLLMAILLYGFWTKQDWAIMVSPVTCVLILAGAVLTGLCVLFVVFKGWRHGAYQLRRGDILAATMFASLDVLIPTTLAVLLWLLIRSLKDGKLFMF